MSSILAIIHYRTAMNIFKKWLTAGVIRTDEFDNIETIIANKYGFHGLYFL